MPTIGAVMVDDSIEAQNIKSLEDKIETLATTIRNVDTMIDELVVAGLKGNSVGKMAETYVSNREEISKLVKALAVSDDDLINYINTNIQIDNESEQAAGQGA